DCANEWEGMRKAQDVALRLPSRGVRAGFRADLQRRIESGEGAPDAVYRYPVSSMSRARLLAAGAAAAGVLISALNMLTEGGRPSAAPLRTPDNNPTVRSSSPLMAGDLEPVSQFGLARVGAQTCASSSNELRARLRSFDDGAREEETWPVVKHAVFNLRV